MLTFGTAVRSKRWINLDVLHLAGWQKVFQYRVIAADDVSPALAQGQHLGGRCLPLDKHGHTVGL